LTLGFGYFQVHRFANASPEFFDPLPTPHMIEEMRENE